MNRLSDFEFSQLVTMYSGSGANVRKALLHAQRILSEKNPEPKPQPKPQPKPKPHLPRGPRFEEGTERGERFSDVIKAFFWGK